MNILFYDVASPIAYTTEFLNQKAIRGTESTVLMIAQSLAKQFTIYLAQHLIHENNYQSGIHYISIAAAQAVKPDIVIVLRDYRVINQVTQLFPKAQRFLWLHNLPPRRLYDIRDELIRARYALITVSNFHKQTVIKRLSGKWYQQLFSYQKRPYPYMPSIIRSPMI